MKLSIQGIGAVTPLDDYPAPLFRDLADEPNEGQKSAGLYKVEDTSGVFDFVSKKKLRRVDHFSRLGLLAAGRAIEDTDPEIISKQNMGIIVATGFGALETTFGFLDSYIEKGDRLASPTHFSNSVHNAAAAHISICYGIQGPNLTVSQFDLSFICALMTAQIWLYERKADAVLVGACDAFCDVLGYCINEFYKEKKCKFYGFGESAFFFIVTRGDQKSRYGYINDISMGGPDNLDMLHDKDNLMIISPSAVEPCCPDFSRFVKKKDQVVLINQLSAPTDCGTTLFRAMGFGMNIQYLKQGKDGCYGRFNFVKQ